MIPHIRTTDGVSVFVFGQAYNVSNTDKQFNELMDHVRHGREQATLDLIERIKRGMEKVAQLSPNISYRNGSVFYKDVPIYGYAVTKLVGFIEQGMDVTPLARFLDKIQNNPIQSVIEELYQFLEVGKIPLTQNGNFLVYKAIRRDWKDIHSGTNDNSIGKVVRMDPVAVDTNRNMTCSYGLHVCSFAYLPHFADANGHVIICEVNPEHVRAIPADYDNTKMRVSQYVVLGELKGYYTDNRDVLAESEVITDVYTVWVSGNGTGWKIDDEFEDYENALDLAEDIKEVWNYVEIRNSNDEVLYTAR